LIGTDSSLIAPPFQRSRRSARPAVDQVHAAVDYQGKGRLGLAGANHRSTAHAQHHQAIAGRRCRRMRGLRCMHRCA
jgi:hypothetical protein